jgi:hypothetical protein
MTITCRSLITTLLLWFGEIIFCYLLFKIAKNEWVVPIPMFF